MEYLAKKSISFLQDNLSVYTSLFILINVYNLAKKKTTFLQNIPFTLINVQSCKKEIGFFCKIFHLLVYVSVMILVNAQSYKKENEFFARYSVY